MNKKRLSIAIVLLLTLASAAITTSCTSSVSNGLMDEAATRTSALEFSYFDGDIVSRYLLFDQDSIDQVMERLDSVQASRVTNWSLDDITLPIYGLSIADKSGYMLNVAWSNGYWITREGNVYTFDFDFETLRDYSCRSRDSINFSHFPNAQLLTKDENGWNNTLMAISRPVEDSLIDLHDDTDGITMTLVDSNRETVNVVFSNDSNEEWMYGQGFFLTVLLDNEWYIVPPPMELVFTLEGLIVPPGGEAHHTYNLSIYGDLPSGTYRITAHGLYVIFDL